MSAHEHQERLARDPDPLVQEIYGRPHTEAEFPALPSHLDAHEAHVTMLAAAGIIDPRSAASLLEALGELRSSPESLALRPELNDLFTCTEAHLVHRLGEDVGGRLHTGRSRNDLGMALARMSCRDMLLELAKANLELRRTLLERSVDDADVLFPGYTHHSQQAQPVTFGHFLLAHHDALGRDLKRVREAYETVNRSPLGGAALAGTSFPIDRGMEADLLGFDGIVENTIDASGSRDFQLQAVSAAATLCATIDRLAESLIIYSSSEFGYVELDDACASVSSIMPQKKNPVALEMVEALSARAIGRLSVLFLLMKSTTVGMSRELVYCDGETFAALTEAMQATRLTQRVLSGLSVDAERSRAAVVSGYSTATDLAELLVRDHALSFRQAHRVVGRAVAATVGSGVPLSASILEAAGAEVLGRVLGLSEDEVAGATTPEAILASHDTVGGPNPAEVRRMAAEREAELVADEEWVNRCEGALSAAGARRREAVDHWRKAGVQ